MTRGDHAGVVGVVDVGGFAHVCHSSWGSDREQRSCTVPGTIQAASAAALASKEAQNKKNTKEE
jgi:hypothetical protein